jgi:dynein heavy chain
VEDVELDRTNPDFRLWLTSMPSKFFPVSVLQNGVKMTFEPPKGMKLNLRTALLSVPEDAFLATKTPDTWRKVLFALMLFHATILERKKFGPLGWNIPYEFTDGDRDVCIMQARMLVDEYDEPPWKVLNILTAVVNYGGRVTDTWDIRLIGNMLKAYLNENVTRDGYKFTASGVYRSINATDKQGYLDFVSELPVNASPEAFGLHDNADITYAQNETLDLFATILKLQPRQNSGGGKSRDDVIADVATDIQVRMRARVASRPRARSAPPPISIPLTTLPLLRAQANVAPEFDYEDAVVKYPTKYEESMNTVLQQEIIRYNKLLKEIHASLRSIKKALKGEVVMSEELEKMGTSLFNNQVPESWSAKAYPSLKPLAAWINDLKVRAPARLADLWRSHARLAAAPGLALRTSGRPAPPRALISLCRPCPLPPAPPSARVQERTRFIQTWFDHGKPSTFWISGFYFPQAFLTGTLQNYARKRQLPIDTISWGYSMVDKRPEELTAEPEVGVYIYGLFIEVRAHLACAL